MSEIYNLNREYEDNICVVEELMLKLPY